MTIFRTFPALPALALASVALLAACGGPAEQTETPDEFAARINGTAASSATQPGQAAPGQQTAAKIATPLPGAAPGPMVPGTQTDPAAISCGAPRVAEYLGRSDASDVRQAVTETAKARGGVRFVRPGEARTQDFNNNRLNVMLDASGVIRDFRCG